MPKSARRLPAENRRVLCAWQQAKKENPELTEGEFAMTIWGPPKSSKRMTPFLGEKERAELHKRQLQSRARYFRLVRSGERTPKKLNYSADHPTTRDLFNVTIGSGKNTKSFNLILSQGTSRLDAFKMLKSKEMKKIARRVARALRGRYPADVELDLSDTPTSIRSIRQSRRPEQIFPSKRVVNA